VFDLWRFVLDVQQVITTRVTRMMAGGLSLREARRMISENQAAYADARLPTPTRF
jgi:hypothetical protein